MRLKVLDISASFHARTVIGLNPVEWLIAPVHSLAVESRTARVLVTDHYFGEVNNFLSICYLFIQCVTKIYRH